MHFESHLAIYILGMRCHKTKKKKKDCIFKVPNLSLFSRLDPFKNSMGEIGFLCQFESEKTMFLYESKSLA